MIAMKHCKRGVHFVKMQPTCDFSIFVKIMQHALQLSPWHLDGKVVVVILHPIFPIVAVPEGVVVVMGPTVSYITGRKENMYSNIP